MRSLEYRLEREFDRIFKTTGYGAVAENRNARELEIYALGKEHGRQLERQEKMNENERRI